MSLHADTVLICGAAGALLYTWCIYPIVLAVLRSRPALPRLAAYTPTVTVLLTCNRGAETIGSRIRNILDQDYPPDKLAVLVAIDGGPRDTLGAALAIPDPRVRVLALPAMGKSATQSKAVSQVSSEIIVFTDIDTVFRDGFLRSLLQAFADPRVGCTTARLELAGPEGICTSGQSAYWRYETWMRRMESSRNLLVTATGACMACRTHLVGKLIPGAGEDCTIPLNVRSQGYRVVHCDAAVAVDCFPGSAMGEIRARSRMTCRNLYGTFQFLRLLNPTLYPGPAASLWSHKLLRWLTPAFLLTLLIVPALSYPRYLPLLAVEAAFYLLAALAALRVPPLARWQPTRAMAGFLICNIGFASGITAFLAGRSTARYGQTEPSAQ